MRVALFLAALLLLAHESYWLENTLHGSRLFWWAFTIGCFFGFLPSVISGFFRPHRPGGLFAPATRRLRFSAITGMSFGLLFPALASLANREMPVDPIHQKRFVVTDKALGGKNRPTMFIYFDSSPKVTERIEVDGNFYDRVSVGDEMTLMLQHGVLGFEVVRGWHNP